MSELPKSWSLTKFTDVFDIQGGTQPPKSAFQYEPKSGYIQLLQIRDFGERPVPTYVPDTDTLKKCTEQDILIARYGASIGRILTGLSGAYNVAMAKVDIPEEMQKRFVYYLLKSEIFQAPLRLVSRSAQSGFNKQDLAEIELPIAPLNEQKRIADKFDSLLARVDACRDRLDHASRIIQRFRQAVLDAATSGQLTEDWRTEHQALDLADGIEEELTEFDFKDAACFDDFRFPPSWDVSRLGDIAEIVGGITKDSKKQYPVDEELPYLRVANVQRGFLDLSEIKTIRVPQNRVEDLLLKPGDILFNEGGDIDKLGRGWIWSGEIERCTFQNHVFRVRLHNNLFEPKFFSWYGNSRGAAYFLSFGKQTTNLASINKSRLSALPVVVPQVEEQREIVRRVELLLAYADRLEVRYQNALRQVEQITPVLLSTAFRGELVPQDPNDEPATVLLEQIRAEQIAKPKRVVVNRKPKMSKMTKESVKEIIRKLPTETFSFDELRERISGDYDSFKDILFTLLSEAEPSLIQVFDQEAKAMRFVRGNK